MKKTWTCTTESFCFKLFKQIRLARSILDTLILAEKIHYLHYLCVNQACVLLWIKQVEEVCICSPIKIKIDVIAVLSNQTEISVTDQINRRYTNFIHGTHSRLFCLCVKRKVCPCHISASAFSCPERLFILTPVFAGPDWWRGEGRSDGLFLLFQSYSEGHVPFGGSFREEPVFSSMLIYTLSMALCVGQQAKWLMRAILKNEGWSFSWIQYDNPLTIWAKYQFFV